MSTYTISKVNSLPPENTDDQNLILNLSKAKSKVDKSQPDQMIPQI